MGINSAISADVNTCQYIDIGPFIENEMKKIKNEVQHELQRPLPKVLIAIIIDYLAAEIVITV